MPHFARSRLVRAVCRNVVDGRECGIAIAVAPDRFALARREGRRIVCVGCAEEIARERLGR